MEPKLVFEEFMSRTMTDVQMMRHFIDSHVRSVFSSVVDVDGRPECSLVTLFATVFDYPFKRSMLQ
jgi:hypothetical protein